MEPQTHPAHPAERQPWDAPELITLSVGDSAGPPPAKDFPNPVEDTITDGGQYFIGPS